MTTGKTEEFNFVQAGPGGLCFAHGPYTEGHQCPKFPACSNDPHNPEYVATGARLISAPKERTRLEREVVDTVKRERRAELAIGAFWDRQSQTNEPANSEELGRLGNESYEAQNAREAAIDALLSFEAEHK